MDWSPGKLTIIKWDQIPSGLTAQAFREWYDIVFQLKGSYPRKKGKYVFTSLHIFRLLTENKEVFDYAGRMTYTIRLEGKSLESDLLLLLADRTHRLFNDEFDKRKRTTPWEDHEIPDFDPSLVRDELDKIIFK